MRVRYEERRHPVPSVDGGGGAHLTDGREYQVIEVHIEARDGGHVALLRLSGDDGTPALFDGRGFAVVEPAVPSTWQMELGDQYTSLGPPEFLAPGFWDAFYGRDADAEAVFRRVVAES